MLKMQSVLNYINDFDRAAQNYAFKGSQHPDTWADIEREYTQTKKRLQNAVKSLYGVPTYD